jgi:glycosyltransferase involved in cell wall biosynthesis
MRILTTLCYYYPGFRAGGPIRTVANLVNRLGEEFDFHIITSDRDSGDVEPYLGLSYLCWNRVSQAQVFYTPPGLKRPLRLVRLFSRTPHELLYLNSLFDPAFTLLPLFLRGLGVGPGVPVVLAPRGEFSAGALGLKKTKKAIFLFIARLFGLYRGVIWQASSEYEAADIRAWMERNARVMVAPNLPSPIHEAVDLCVIGRQTENPLRLVFFSRLSPKKNLDVALRLLHSVRVPVDFSIYGPQEDRAYLEQCRALAASLPGHIKVFWHGAIHPEQVAGVLARQDLFLFPTRGENYGHVIAEALSVGTPVLIADTTPWRDLASAGVGWDLPLGDESAFVDRIEYCAGIAPTEYAVWRERVRRYAGRKLAVESIIEANRQLFLCAAGRVAVSARE